MLCETQIISDACLQEAIAEQTERRRLHRKSFLRKATIVVPSERTRVEAAYCRDISRDGIGLLHEVPLEMGSEFTLAIPMVGSVLKVQCEINWCREVGERQYFSGSAYKCMSTPQTLVLMSAALSQELNRRLYRRYPFVRSATLQDAEGCSQPAFCRDISKTGIGLIHREPLSVGRTTVTMTLNDDTELTATADLQRCTPIGLGWYCSGGRFPLEELDA